MEDQAFSTDKFDLFSPSFKADPFPTYRHMREAAPIYGHKTPEKTTIWYITRFEDVVAVLQDDHNFCKDPRNTGLPEVSGSASRRTAMHQLINENMLFSDPPDHTRLRALVSQAFTPRRVSELSTYISATAEKLIEGFEADGRADLINDYALPLPVYVISRLLGIPDDDRQQVARWSQAIISPGSRNLNYSSRRRQVQALIRYLDNMFNLRTSEPQDDLISALVHAEQEGDRLSGFELSSMVVLLLVTGHETTVNLIGNGALALLSNPQQRTMLAANPALWDSAIEELLRYDGPVETSTSRWARRDVHFQGRLIKRGDLVRVVLSSANRDAQQFSEPDKLKLNRTSNKHLAFGYGIHYCLGAPLARLEAKIALHALFSKLSTLRLSASQDQLHWRSGVLFRGLQQLEVVWTSVDG